MDEIDGRCHCNRCVARTEQTYQMRSYPCRNCGSGPFLLTFRKGDKAAALNCPICGNWQVVAPDLRTQTAALLAAGDNSKC